LAFQGENAEKAEYMACKNLDLKTNCFVAIRVYCKVRKKPLHLYR